MKCVLNLTICAAALPLLLVIGAWAQISGGSIVGSVLDSSGAAIGGAKVEAFRLNGRDFQQLVGLQPGVYASPDSFNGQRGGIEFNGASAFGNNLLMDGVDMSFGENSASASDKAAGTEVGRAAGNATGN